MNCTTCGTQNPPDYKFCENCGEALEQVVCPSCSHSNLEGMKFCEECGARLEQIACPTCAHKNPREFTFCEECGSQLDIVKCPACDHKNDREFKFCEECGQSLARKSAHQTSLDSKRRDITFTSKEPPKTPDFEDRICMPKLLSSLGMRFLLASVAGFGIERMLNWLAETMLSP